MTVWSLAAFAGGFLAVGLVTGLAAYHLALPQILARAGLPTVKAIWSETEALLLARALRPGRRRVRWGRRVGGQRGRHLT